MNLMSKYLGLMVTQFQDSIFPLQDSNLGSQLRDMLLHCALIPPHMGLDFFGSVGVLQGVHRVVVL